MQYSQSFTVSISRLPPLNFDFTSKTDFWTRFSFSFLFFHSLVLIFSGKGPPASSISLPWYIFAHQWTVKENKVIDKVNPSNLDPNAFLRWVFEAICKAALKLAEIGGGKVRRQETHAMPLSHFCSSRKMCCLGYWRWGRRKYVRCYVHRVRWHYTARKMSAWITCSFGCSWIANFPLYKWTGMATSRSYWRHGVLSLFWYKLCSVQGLSRCSFTSVHLFTYVLWSLCVHKAGVHCAQL